MSWWNRTSTTANCPSRQVLDRIGDTWSVLVVASLAQGPRRYTELAQRIDGISPKMLTQTLRGLERDGLITRTVHAGVPPRVDYAAHRARAQPAASWSGRWRAGPQTHMDDVLAARAAYDGGQAYKGEIDRDVVAGRPRSVHAWKNSWWPKTVGHGLGRRSA